MSEAQTNGRIQIPDANPESPVTNMQQLLAANIGKEIVGEFLIGADSIEEKSGILYAVRPDYFVLFDDRNLVYVVCDIYALRFATFYLPGTRPGAKNGATETTSLREPAPADGGNGRAVTAAAMAPLRTTPNGQAAFQYAKRKANRLE
ncbi:MAG: hypothetical protein PHI98_06145 [Eubacteriales bacterium]|nr:hypothetical protein [Eubacteriales bacterium]